MKSRNPLQRVLRARMLSFASALTLHLGWALALGLLLVALRRGLAGAAAPASTAVFVPALLAFAAVCALAGTLVWGWRRPAVRWIRDLNDDDVAALLAAACTGAVSMLLVTLLAAAVPSLARSLSRPELDAVMMAALAVIGVLAVNLGWILFEGLGGAAPPVPGKLEASFARRGP